MTRVIVSSAHSSGKCAPRQSKNFINVSRSLSYFSPARSESGSRQARNPASASALNAHSDLETDTPSILISPASNDQDSNRENAEHPEITEHTEERRVSVFRY